MTLLLTAFLFFAVAAVAGAYLARAHVTRTRPAGLVVLGHPLLVASGFILLGGGYVRTDGSSLVAAAMIVLAVAAAGGMTLAWLRVQRGAAPTPLIAGHALLALTGLGLVGYELVAGAPDVPADFPREPQLPEARAGEADLRDAPETTYVAPPPEPVRARDGE